MDDTNGDGWADEYHCFSKLIPSSTGSHDYVITLEVDADHQFHFIDLSWILRSSVDRREFNPLDTGWLTVFQRIPDLVPVIQMRIRYSPTQNCKL